MEQHHDPVLVTGAAGFIAKHLVLALLEAGYAVRGTVRSEAKAAEVRRAMAAQGADTTRLSFVLADLTRDDRWDEAVAGCRFVHHTASPFPAALPADKFALVPVARGGTLRVVEASLRAGVERMVVTSSVAAIYYGHEARSGRRFTDADFSNVASDAISAYAVSKTLAEQAAWEAAAGTPMELVAINPSLVLGPLLDPNFGTSVSIIRMMMLGRLPAVPNMSFGIVDVRDVVAAHLAAMTARDAPGRRFILSAGSRSLREIGAALAADLPERRWRMPKVTLPDALVKIVAALSPSAAQIVNELGEPKKLDTTPAETILGVSFKQPEEAIRAAADGLIQWKLV